MASGKEWCGESMSMAEGRNRIDLNSLFQSTQQRMVAELTGIRGAVDHGGTLGDETELAWLDFLARVLPNRYRVANGFVVDADGLRSDQMDVIVFDRQYSPPLFMGGNVQYVPAEAVYAVFEVKQRIDSRNLRLACDKAASVRSLRRTSAVIPSADGALDPKPPHRILAGILALSNSSPSAFPKALRDVMAQVQEAQRLDLGCALNHGSFAVSYGESTVEGVVGSSAATSLVTFLFRLLTDLQAIGTVPAIDYSAYVRALEIDGGE